MLGSEGDGLSSHWLREADESVCVPMSAHAMALGVDSLNVVAAAAVACYALMRGDGLTGAQGRLSGVLAAAKYWLESLRHSNTMAPRPTSQTSSENARLTETLARTKPSSRKSVFRPNSTVAVIRPQFRPFLFAQRHQQPQADGDQAFHHGDGDREHRGLVHLVLASACSSRCG